MSTGDPAPPRRRRTGTRSTRRLLGALAGLAGAAALTAGGVALWAKATRDAVFERRHQTHEVDFPIPFPLTDQEVAALREARREEVPPGADPLEGVDLDAVALARALDRGQHLVEARYACGLCHGEDFGGGVMMRSGLIGTWLAPNITSGGRTATWRPSAWDRAVRHGVLPDGRGSLMPISDFEAMSDRELSDVIAWIRSRPPVEGDVAAPTFGPLGTWLVATGEIVPEALRLEDHHAAHAVEPPPEAATVAFGEHVARICTGCHRRTFEGGPMPFGPPTWPPAANLTPDPDGLDGWSFDDFRAALVENRRPDGTPLRAPMDLMAPVAGKMSETELRAMWAFLQSLPPRQSP